MSEELRMKIADRMKSAREALGLTQDEVAYSLGLKRKSYNHIETGRNSLRIEHLVKLPEILGRSVNYFLGVGTKELSNDEVELVELYRSLPAGPAREYTLELVRGLVNQYSQKRKGTIDDDLEQEQERSD